MHGVSQEAIRITTEINSRYHEPAELRQLFSELIGKPVDESFGLFPPFYTDCGKNITVGKHVFINSCCQFQDQGGITIGDGSLIGHSAIITTLNHEFAVEKRSSMRPAPVVIGKNGLAGGQSDDCAGGDSWRRGHCGSRSCGDQGRAAGDSGGRGAGEGHTAAE